MPTLILLAWRNLLSYPWRTFATVIGVAVGIAAVIATLSVGDNVTYNVQQALDEAGGKADLLVISGTGRRTLISNPDELEPLLAAHPDVKEVMQVLEQRSEPKRSLDVTNNALIPGIDTGFVISGRETANKSDALEVELLEGVLPQAGSNAIALSQGFAELRDVSVGDEIIFTSRFGDIAMLVAGIMDDSFGLASGNSGRIALANIEDVRTLFKLSGRVSFLELFLEPRADLETSEVSLEAVLQDAFPDTYEIAPPAQSSSLATGIVDTIEAGLRVLAATLLALGAFMAYNTFSASVVERTKRFALLRTIALTRGQVQRLALYEAFLVSILGILLGILLSYGLTRLNSLALGYEYIGLRLPRENLFLAAGLGLVVTLLAGYLPARTASRTRPVQAVRNSLDSTAALSPQLGWPVLILGIGLSFAPWQGIWALAGSGLAMLFLFLGVAFISPIILKPCVRLFKPILQRLFGAAGVLGASFSERNAVRNGVAIAAVVVGMGITIGVGSMVSGINKEISSWINATVVGDMFITSPTGFPEGFEAAAYADIEGLEYLSPVALRTGGFQPPSDPKNPDAPAPRRRNITLILVDAERFHPERGFGGFQYLEGNEDEGYEALLGGGKVLAASTIRERFKVKAGDDALLRTNAGMEAFEVSGVVVDFTGGGEAFVGSIGDLDRFGGGRPNLFVSTVKDGYTASDVRQSLNERFPELYLDITLNERYRERIFTLSQQTFATTNSLLLLAILISALGVTNTLGMNLSGRQHELAALRAMGLTKRNLRRLVTAESLVVVIIGSVLGILSGLILARVISEGSSALTGFAITPRFPWRLILIALLASPVIGFFASLIPARRASQVQPLLALKES